MLIVRQGHVLAFGDNLYGAAGQPVGTATPSPTLVSGLDDVVSVAAGQLNSLALTTSWQQFIIPLPDASKLTAVKSSCAWKTMA